MEAIPIVTKVAGTAGYYYNKIPSAGKIVINAGNVILSPLSWLIILVGTLILAAILVYLIRRYNPCWLRNVPATDGSTDCNGMASVSWWRTIWVSVLPSFILVFLIVIVIGTIVSYGVTNILATVVAQLK